MNKYTAEFLKYIFLLFLFLLVSSNSNSRTYRVFFRDKGPGSFYKGSPLELEAIQSLSEKSLKRRAKVLFPDSLVSFEDVPLYQPYIDSVMKFAGKCRLKLKWKNYAVFDLDSVSIANIRSFPFVKKVQPTSSKITEAVSLISSGRSVIGQILLDGNSYNCDRYNYGESLKQLELLNIPALHRMGITGAGVLTGFLDTGFRWKFLNAFNKTNIKAEHDFVYGDSSTSNKPFDAPDQDHHGTLVFATVAGFIPDTLIGAAYSADFILAKTEDIKSETRIEEDNYAAAIEWLESSGADISSSSLGYFTFDSTESQTLYSDLDGNSTIASQAINLAVKRGMICVSAAGNKGPGGHSIVSPADADSALTIAATETDGVTPAKFTSRGLLENGKQKPDFAAMGVSVFTLDPATNGKYLKAGGTSLATPLMSGAITLLLSVFPELKPYEVVHLLKKNSAKDLPDSILGYGIPDIYKTMLDYGIIISPVSSFTLKQFRRVFAGIAAKTAINEAVINIRFKNRTAFEKYKLNYSGFDNFYIADIPLSLFENQPAECYITAGNVSGKRRYPFDTAQFAEIDPIQSQIACGIETAITNEISTESDDIFLYPSIADGSISSIDLTITLPFQSDVKVSVYDYTGKLITYNNNSNETPGFRKISIDIRNLATGAYFVKTEYSGQQKIKGFLKVR